MSDLSQVFETDDTCTFWLAIYLSEVQQCDIYLAILGNEYGRKSEDGKSPTELEFEHATKEPSRTTDLCERQ